MNQPSNAAFSLQESIPIRNDSLCNALIQRDLIQNTPIQNALIRNDSIRCESPRHSPNRYSPLHKGSVFGGLILFWIGIHLPFLNLLAGAEEPVAERLVSGSPSILWLSFEDTSPYDFGCYGGHNRTPHVDQLARRGIQFNRASSTAPYCSAARSSIISGCYATTYATDWHRSPRDVPANQYFFPRLLKEAGYFTTNNAKTDYNSTRMGQLLPKVWTEQGNKATYQSPNRQPGQPFFSVFNNNITHMTCVRTFTTEGREHSDFAARGIEPDSLVLPPHVPDLPEIRSDFARHKESSQKVDAWVKMHLDELERLGLSDDTIVFVWSDHGGCLPRGKAFPFRTGLHPVLIVYVPEKFQHLLDDSYTIGTPSDRLVGFEDLGPTVLRLAGLEVREYMQGSSFLAPGAEEKTVQFCFRNNTGPHFEPIRTAFDGQFHYVRSYRPFKPFALHQDYQWGMPGQVAWDQYRADRGVEGATEQYYGPKPTEMLFDVTADPWELTNLADQPDYQAKLQELRLAVSQHIRESKDLGFFPLAFRDQPPNMYRWVRDSQYPLDQLLEMVELASDPSVEDLPQLLQGLQDQRPEFRYWATSGMATLGQRGLLIDTDQQSLQRLHACLKDPHLDVVIGAAEALSYVGAPQAGLDVLFGIAQTSDDQRAWSALEGLGPIALPLVPRLQSMDNQNARGVLITLGQLPAIEYYPASQRAKAESLNRRIANDNGLNPSPRTK